MAISPSLALTMYKQYQATLDDVFSGRVTSDALAQVATGPQLRDDQTAARKLKDAGRHQRGTSRVFSFKSQQIDGDAISFYVCLDVSRVDVLDATGKSVVSSNRATQIPLTVREVRTAAGLRIERETVWSGKKFC